MPNSIRIRNFIAYDSPTLAELATQLGYPCSIEIARSRVGTYIGNPNRTVIVAEVDGRVIGWTSLDVVEHFYVEPQVEISGFIVDKEYWSLGIGEKLMKRVETWVKTHGQSRLRLYTNSIRKDAHRFYERLGFEKKKESYVYEKEI